MDPVTCLIAVLWFEGREFYRQPDEIMAIADVIQNRVEDQRYPDDVCAVIYEPRQFSFTHDGLVDTPVISDAIEERAIKVVIDIAKRSMRGERVGITSTHYHTTSVSPAWASAYAYDGQLGQHRFYTNETPYR